jgi:thioredoxin 1
MKFIKSSLMIIVCSFLLIRFAVLMTGCSAPPPKPPVSQASFDEELSTGELVLVKFGAQWCGPCRMVDKELHKLAEQEDFPAKIIEVDVDSNPELARRYQVGGIPHMILVRSNEVIDTQVGYLSAAELEDWVNSYAGMSGTADET